MPDTSEARVGVSQMRKYEVLSVERRRWADTSAARVERASGQIQTQRVSNDEGMYGGEMPVVGFRRRKMGGGAGCSVREEPQKIVNN
jgi:hypothetical protein